jgi:hypothetical protein
MLMVKYYLDASLVPLSPSPSSHYIFNIYNKSINDPMRYFWAANMGHLWTISKTIWQRYKFYTFPISFKT